MPHAAAIHARGRVPGFAPAQDGYGTGMTNPEDTKQATQDDDDRQEAGEREQGVRTEDSDDLSSPQFTVDADEKR
jgi:hypothetical protein